MKSVPTYVGEPRKYVETITKLHARIAELEAENERLHAMAAVSDDHALTEFAKALRRRQRVDL